MYEISRRGLGYLPLFAVTALLAGAGLSAASVAARAETAVEDPAYLDPPYEQLVHPLEAEIAPPDFLTLVPRPFPGGQQAPIRSDAESVISYQAAVKSQGARGTCTFFSTTAVLESLLMRFQGFSRDLTLSEQWLAYVVGRGKTSDGSFSNVNFNQLAYYGTVEASLLPYEGDSWKAVSDKDLSKQRCGGVPGSFLRSCLVAHFDPRYLTAADDALKSSDPAFFDVRNRARQFRAQVLAPKLDWHAQRYEVTTTGEIKSLLAQGVPLTLDINFFFGSWNHRLTEEYGIPRDLDAWAQGLVGYPEWGSVDRTQSLRHGAGHSVEVVGYDDEQELKTRVKMNDGSWREFTYRGVYFIKNSWGTSGFGAKFSLDGVGHPGYGMITQKYAHEQGAFYHLPLY